MKPEEKECCRELEFNMCGKCSQYDINTGECKNQQYWNKLTKILAYKVTRLGDETRKGKDTGRSYVAINDQNNHLYYYLSDNKPWRSKLCELMLNEHSFYLYVDKNNNIIDIVE